MEKVALSIEEKKSLHDACIRKQEEQNESYKLAIKTAQESANEEEMSEFDQMESFREQLQADTDMYSRKLDEGVEALSSLNKINPEVEHEVVEKGALVETENQKIFFAVSLGKVKVGDVSYYVLSQDSPLYNVIKGMKSGESFEFMDKKNRIVSIL